MCKCTFIIILFLIFSDLYLLHLYFYVSCYYDYFIVCSVKLIKIHNGKNISLFTDFIHFCAGRFHSPESHCHSENELFSQSLLSGPNMLISSDGYFHQESVTCSNKYLDVLDFRMDAWMILDAPPILSFKLNLLPVSLLLWIFKQALMAGSTSVFHDGSYSTG